MNKSSKNSKEDSSQEINKAIKKFRDAEGKKHKKDSLKNYEGSKSLTGSSTGASVVGRTSISKMKKLKKKKDIAGDFDLDVDED